SFAASRNLSQSPPTRIMIRQQYSIELDYVVSQRAPLILQIEAARTARQRVAGERLVTAPELAVEPWVDPETGTRQARLIAPVGHLTVRYEATVDLDHLLADPREIPETPVERLPTPVLRY